jgi:hypothetical protein
MFLNNVHTYYNVYNGISVSHLLLWTNSWKLLQGSKKNICINWLHETESFLRNCSCSLRQEFLALYGTWRFNALFKNTSCFSQYWTRWIKSEYSHSISPKSVSHLQVFSSYSMIKLLRAFLIYLRHSTHFGCLISLGMITVNMVW